MNQRWLGHLAYVAVGAASLLLAVFVASRVVAPAHSQDEAQEPAAEASASPEGGAVEGATENTGAQAEAPAETPAETLPPAEAADIPDNVSFLEPYVFDVREGRRNPFRMPMAADGNNMDVVLPGTPLERYDIDELKLAGIMWDIRLPKAMIIDPQGEVHVLGKDDRIGRKRGYIAVIREGEVVVVETSTFNGENTYSTRIMRIEQ